MQRARTSSQETLLTAAAITLTQHRETVGFAFSHLSSSLRILRRSLQCPTLEIVGSAHVRIRIIGYVKIVTDTISARFLRNIHVEYRILGNFAETLCNC